LGVRNQPFLAQKTWQAQFSYQYGYSYQLFVGDQRNDAAGPFGQPPQRRVNLFNLDLAYGVTNRLGVGLTLPFMSGGGAVQMGTPESHQAYDFHAGGIGDVSVGGEYWLSDPAVPSRVQGSVGLGIQAPTGSDAVTGTVYVPGQGDQERPIDESFQPGNGGWILLLRAQGTAQITGPLFAYASGYYGMSLTEHTEVVQGGALRGVPDTYSGRLGAAYLLPILQGLGQGVVLSFGGLINGVTVKDVVGGGDLYWRRPGYEVYVAPGLTWTLGPNMANITIPVRVYQNKLDSLLDQSLGRHIGAGFVPWLFQATYARRF
jgi:hypothetical protein